MTTHPKRPERKVVEGIWLGCFALAVAVMLYGVIRYPYAPIRLRDDGYYRDKAGQVYSEAQFHCFKMWEYSLLGSFAVLAAVSVTLSVSNLRGRSR
jgi:hypothetical protein